MALIIENSFADFVIKISDFFLSKYCKRLFTSLLLGSYHYEPYFRLILGK
jgi:hypothetical protein